MQKTGWKTLCFVSWGILLFTILWVGWGWYLVEQEEKQVNECYYEICNEYEEAILDGDVCFCKEKDVLGNFVVAKTIYMKD